MAMEVYIKNPVTDALVVGTGGDIAPGAVDSGNPIKIGGYASGSPPTTESAADRVNAWFSLNGALVAGVPLTVGNDTYDNSGLGGFANVFNGSAAPILNANIIFDHAAGVWTRQRGDTNGTVVQRGVSSTFWSYAATAGGIVSSTADVVLKTAAGAGVRNYLASLRIQHDTLSAVTEFVIKDGSTIIYRGKLQTAANEAGVNIDLPVPLRSTANAALNFALLSSVTGGVFVNAQGHTGS